MAKRAKRPKYPLPPFGLDMDVDEAFERFVGTDPREVDEIIRRSKTKRPLGAKKKTPGGKKGPPGTPSKNVVSLRDRRMRKRNYGR
jgi:hypothetical protein